jgi:acyl-CoA synthetase (AMP-forming)/AMP-acid ligase II
MRLSQGIHQFPGVHECAVIGIPSARWSEAARALVVPRSGAGKTLKSELRRPFWEREARSMH